MASTPRTLSRAKIVAAAREILAEDGYSALSMRQLAARLGVKAPSLYNHFSTKDDVLAELDDEFTASIDFQILEEQPWREAFETFFISLRKKLLANPAYIPIYLDGPKGRPGRLRYADAYASAFVRAGFRPRVATRIAIVLRAYLSGSVSTPLTSRFQGSEGDYADFPSLNQVHKFKQQEERLNREAFTMGLRILLDGFEQELGR